MVTADLMEKLVSLAKRRGYVFQSSEIYGGTGSVWDYGSLGVELKRNVKELWWSSMVHQREDVDPNASPCLGGFWSRRKFHGPASRVY